MSDDLKALNNEAENNDNAACEAADNNISDSSPAKDTYVEPQKHKKKKSKKNGVHKSADKDLTKNTTTDSESAQKIATEEVQSMADQIKEADNIKSKVADTLSSDTTDADLINNESDFIDTETALSDTAPCKDAADKISDINSTDTISDNVSDDVASESEAAVKNDKGKNIKITIYKLLQVVFIAGFIIFGYLFIDETVIQPLRTKNSIDKTRDLYKRPSPVLPKPTTGSSPAITPVITPATNITADPEPTLLPPTPTPDPNRDAKGRLLQFAELLAVNEDVKGWLTIPDTNIDYVVVQSGRENPEYYLDKDIYHEYNKAGTLFIDIHGSVENKSQNLVIHGHNMVSTPEKMFHDLNKYKINKSKMDTVPSYYKKHPLIYFDTIYNTGQWKIFAVFITNGTDKKEDFFDYTRSSFGNSSDFLNFVYQIRIRSELNIDSVDITDNDQLLMLSTCSYEVDDYRTVIAARKVREGEELTVDTKAVTVNKNPLYPKSYYYRYGGKAPKLPATFEEALAAGEINWYTPPELLNQKQEQNKQDKQDTKDKKTDADAKEADKKANDITNKKNDKQDTKKQETATEQVNANQANQQISNPEADITASESQQTAATKTATQDTGSKKTDTKNTDTKKSDTQSSKNKKEQQTDNLSTEKQDSDNNEPVKPEADSESTDTKPKKQENVKNDSETSDSKPKKKDTDKETKTDEASSNTGSSADKKTNSPELTPFPETTEATGN